MNQIRQGLVGRRGIHDALEVERKFVRLRDYVIIISINGLGMVYFQSILEKMYQVGGYRRCKTIPQMKVCIVHIQAKWRP